jgi:hypothetical protein
MYLRVLSTGTASQSAPYIERPLNSLSVESLSHSTSTDEARHVEKSTQLNPQVFSSGYRMLAFAVALFSLF